MILKENNVNLTDLFERIKFRDESDTNSYIKKNVYAQPQIIIYVYGTDDASIIKIFNSDLWVISPGVPQDAPILRKASKMNIDIISEIEFASWFTNAQIIAITGSNGKTTTVNLLFKMCEINEISPVLGGNVGIAFSDLVLADLQNNILNRLYILEISSFQMERIKHFKPSISIFLNISEDHLDRYKNMDDYINSKLNMIQNQDQNDHIIYNLDDKILNNKFFNAPPKKHGFSLHENRENIFSLS